jgi:hypothetical protein
MAIYTPAKLYVGQPTTSSTTLYTAPASTTVIIKQIILVNTTSTSATITLNHVASAGAAAAANQLVPAMWVPGNSVQTIDLSAVMNTGDFIAGLQGTASAITAHIHGVTIA